MTSIEGEEWRPAAGVEAYEVSSFGRVRAVSYQGQGPRIVAQHFAKHVAHVWLRGVGARRTYVVRHLVAATFGLVKPAGHIWTHENTEPRDNRVSNIISLTQQQLVVRNYARGRCQHVLARGQVLDHQVGVFEAGVMVAQRCTGCQLEKPLAEFRTIQREGREPKRLRRCRDCCDRRGGTVAPGKARQGHELRLQGLRRCTACQTIQPLDAAHFRRSSTPKHHGYTYLCFTCKPPRPEAVGEKNE